MPGNAAENGDVYRVHRDATLDGQDTKEAHPVACVSFAPHDPVAWKGIPRISSTSMPGDLPSGTSSALPFTREGHWTLRFIRAVRKDLTGHPDLCPYLATLPEPELSAVVALYRHRGAAGAAAHL